MKIEENYKLVENIIITIIIHSFNDLIDNMEKFDIFLDLHEQRTDFEIFFIGLVM